MPIDSRDALSAILQDVHIGIMDVEELDFPTPWCVVHGKGATRFYLILQGNCHFEIEESDVSGDLGPGDLLVILQRQSHSLREVCEGRTRPSEMLSDCKTSVSLDVALEKKPPTARLVSGSLHLEERESDTLIALLPTYIHIEGVEGKAAPWVAETLGLVMLESKANRPGKQAKVDQLAKIFFIDVLRACLCRSPCMKNDRLQVLMDQEMASVLEIMNDKPEMPWTVATLAKRICMSRSAFASRFKLLFSRTPFQYLLECRMRKASILLSDKQYGIKQIASLSGYANPAAFSNAFKRWSGQTPGDFRRKTILGRELQNGSQIRKPHGCD